MYDSNYLLYIFFTGKIYKVGIVQSRERLDKRFKDLYKQLFESDKNIRKKIKFARVYEGMLDVHIKTCEKQVLKELNEHRLPMYDQGVTEGFDASITLDDIIEVIEKQTRCKLNLLYEDYTPELQEN